MAPDAIPGLDPCAYVGGGPGSRFPQPIAWAVLLPSEVRAVAVAIRSASEDEPPPQDLLQQVVWQQAV